MIETETTLQKQREANRRSYYKHHAKRRAKMNETHRQLRSDPKWRARELKKNKDAYWANIEKSREYHRRWRNAHREAALKYLREYGKSHNADIRYRLPRVLRARIRGCLRGVKSETTLGLLGCSYGFVRAHLEEQFTAGMTWENHGREGWHIDHIVPLSWFGDLLRDPEWQKVACHYTNLQPLWAKDNYAKNRGR